MIIRQGKHFISPPIGTKSSKEPLDNYTFTLFEKTVGWKTLKGGLADGWMDWLGVKSDSRDCYVKSKIENKNKSVQFQELYCTQITIVNFCSALVIRVFVDEIVYLIKIVLMIIHGYVTPS